MHFDNIVFAGGGNRCLWQAGFWSVAAPELASGPRGVVGVSAGSAIACALFSGTFEPGFARYKRALAANQRNLYLRNLIRPEAVFPHGQMYRDAILHSLDSDALKRLHHGPEIRILIASPPRWASRRLALLLGAIAVGVDAWDKDAVHPNAGMRIGFKPLYMSVRECSTPERLTELIIASSCVPPLTPQAHRDGVALLDGGVVSNVPADWVPHPDGETLVLLSRQFTRLPKIPRRTYVQPSQPIPVGAWDYTNDGAVQSTFDLGRRDGEAFCRNSPPEPRHGASPIYA